MNINVQGLLWACKAIWLQEYREITLKHFGRVLLRLDSEVNLMSAGQTERKLDGGWGVSGIAQALETGNNERFVSFIYSQKPTNTVLTHFYTATQNMLYK